MPREVDEDEALSLLGLALEPARLPPGGRARLLADVERRARYLPFTRPLSELFALPEETMTAVLASAREETAWKAGVLPVERFFHFPAGPAVQPLHAGLVRMTSGAVIPAHRHRDREVTFVLEGAVADESGARRGPGESFDLPAGSIHTLRIEGDGYSVLAVLSGGIEFLGT